MHVLVCELTEQHQHQALTTVFINLFVVSVNRVKAATYVFNTAVFWVFTLLWVGINVSYKFGASFRSEVRGFSWPDRCYCCFHYLHVNTVCSVCRRVSLSSGTRCRHELTVQILRLVWTQRGGFDSHDSEGQRSSRWDADSYVRLTRSETRRILQHAVRTSVTEEVAVTNTKFMDQIGSHKLIPKKVLVYQGLWR